MKDIPLFTTEYGIASLVLQEVPYTGQAYIRVQTSSNITGLIDESVGFCRAVGAQSIYATGDGLEHYPMHTRVLEMQCQKCSIPESRAYLFPVTEQTLESWREIYNQAMVSVDNAAWMSQGGARELLRAGDGYFIHQDGKLLGIGKASAGRIHAVAAVEKGCGEEIMRALCSILQEKVVTLEIAQTNERAMRLYERMGFVTTREISCWYRVWKKD